MAIMEISVVPVGTGSPSVSRFVADCVKILEEKRIKYEVTSMGTEVEGEVGELLRLAEEMHCAPFTKGAQRVVTTIKIDDRRDKKLKMEEKKEAVRKRLSEMAAGR
ncbi:MAG: MTH1187 family thiamine-binding protein [Deltaproteobacteria bacterium]|nr:MAG: MTH1187 family thiamine-binding protein [Deltaproteobacteria bacterium]